MTQVTSRYGLQPYSSGDRDAGRLRRALAQLLKDASGDVLGALVLPRPHDRPSQALELSVHGGVPSSVGGDLVSPPGGVGLRRRGMFWTSVPEAAVDVD